MIRLLLSFILVLFVLTCIVQSVADKHEWSTTPNTVMMDAVDASKIWFRWFGTWIGYVWSIGIIIKDNIYEWIQDFIPAMWKVTYPLLLGMCTPYYVIAGYMDYMSQWTSPIINSFFNDWWVVIGLLVMAAIVWLIVVYGRTRCVEYGRNKYHRCRRVFDDSHTD